MNNHELPEISFSTNKSLIPSETNEFIIYFYLNSSNNSKTQKINPPELLISKPQLLSGNITNILELKNVTLKVNDTKKVILNLLCKGTGNSNISLLITLFNSSFQRNVSYNFIKECFNPNFGLTISTKKPKTLKEKGDIVDSDRYFSQNNFSYYIEGNQTKLYLYIIGKKISNKTHYVIDSNIYSESQLVGKGSIKSKELYLDALNNKNLLEINFDCYKNGYFWSIISIHVKGTMKYYQFYVKKHCEKKEFSWTQIFRSKAFVWIFLGSIFLILLLLLLKDNFSWKSTNQDSDPPIEPNEAALSILYDIKFL